ncbi:MAG TPA: cation:proton antiporter, partial [Pseudomonadales bacterium]|nr:cation:proton antiporter [Pseudomonadales bacterium]
MHSDPFMLALVAAVLGILLVGMASQRLKQPHVVGYLLAGVMLGPDGFALVTAPAIPERMGEIGVMLLLFFVGLEATPRQLFAHWRIALFGPLLQSAAALLLIWPLGLWLGWSLTQVLLFSFIITLSSTAVVLKTLADSGELDSRLGRRLVGILLIQDLAIVPMLIILRYGAGTELQGFDPL